MACDVFFSFMSQSVTYLAPLVAKNDSARESFSTADVVGMIGRFEKDEREPNKDLSRLERDPTKDGDSMIVAV